MIRWKRLALVVSVFVGILAFLGTYEPIAGHKLVAPLSEPSVAVAPIAAHAQNAPNDLMLAAPLEKRLTVLTYTIASAGWACKAIRHEYKGLYQGDGYHLAMCEDGGAYLIRVTPDDDVTVLDCAIASAVGADCFQVVRPPELRGTKDA
jgi:hypothetical protein